jgi:protein-S-isoprenylcysteine O-methyltransferase Ste14
MDASTEQPGEIPTVIAVLARTVVYASLFIGFLLIYLPARLLSRSGIAAPATIGPLQVAGIVIGAIGAALALWCIATFVSIGRGTPAPFDAPRRLVVRGPYRFVRNPMYIGAALVLGGAALFYRSLGILIYTALLLLTAHVLVVLYEERVLARTFGDDYRAYRARVRRWLPKF